MSEKLNELRKQYLELCARAGEIQFRIDETRRDVEKATKSLRTIQNKIRNVLAGAELLNKQQGNEGPAVPAQEPAPSDTPDEVTESSEADYNTASEVAGE